MKASEITCFGIYKVKPIKGEQFYVEYNPVLQIFSRFGTWKRYDAGYLDIITISLKGPLPYGERPSFTCGAEK